MKSLRRSSLSIIAFGTFIIVSSASARGAQSSKQSRFISFNSEDGKIDIDLDLSIPFLSIPLNNEPGPNGGPGPLLNVNTKAITVAGILAALTAFVVPLFFKSPPDHRYRLDDDFGIGQITNSVNDLFLGNNIVTPCVQRVVCALVAKVAKADHPTSNDKIIDGFTSYGWFKEVTNGTAIQEAVAAGREGRHDCSIIYKSCAIPSRLLETILDQSGDF